MNVLPSDAIHMYADLAEILDEKRVGDTTVIVAPPFTHLTDAIDHIWNFSPISIAAQNCHFEDNGAYTGEVSAAFLSDLNCDAVIIGHSERRQYFNEDDAMLAKKVDAAIRHQLLPIFCCGEVLEDRKTGNHEKVVTDQIEKGLFHLSGNQLKQVIIAYEPVWAIGTGETASPEQAQEMHASIRKFITAKYGPETANEISILYGGSVKPSNAVEIFSKPDVDGGLIGGASLDVKSFVEIVDAMKKIGGGLHAV